MSTTEKAIKEYNLTNFELVSGSGATMTAALKSAIDNNEWIVVTGWTPHWKFARWDLKYLKDPKGVYGKEERINTIVRKGLKEDMPEVYKFLDNFKWTPEDMAEVMVWNTENDKPYENAVRWINENKDKVQKWLP
jgi:glycine betaine/proline transport system substrate-binding protein